MYLTQSACTILQTALPSAKAALSGEIAAAWRNGTITKIGDSRPPMRPMRPAKPVLLPPQHMQRRRGGAGRAALLHAIAHIEFNAIDLAWDMIARFADPALPRAFYDDWVRVGDEEAKHFLMLSKRMEAFGLRYGDFPAHDGLWQAAQETADDVLSRLAIAPLVLEARGLDVTPAIIDRLTKAGDSESVAILSIILEEEVGHVSIGRRWFTHIATSRGQVPLTIFQTLVRRHYRGRLKPPFNKLSRDAAGFHADWYEPLVAQG